MIFQFLFLGHFTTSDFWAVDCFISFYDVMGSKIEVISVLAWVFNVYVEWFFSPPPSSLPKFSFFSKSQKIFVLVSVFHVPNSEGFEF